MGDGARRRRMVGRTTLAWVVTSVIAVATAHALGCGGAEFRASGDAGASGVDATSPTVDGGGATDGPTSSDVAAACSPGTVLCNGVCVAGADCRNCAGALFFCRAQRTCLAACGACAGGSAPIECIACNTGQKGPLGTCEENSPVSYCLSGNYTTAYVDGAAGAHCDCSGAAVSNCLGATQVCISSGGTDWCVTCGENGATTNGRPCKGGGTCNAALNPPRCQ